MPGCVNEAKGVKKIRAELFFRFLLRHRKLIWLIPVILCGLSLPFTAWAIVGDTNGAFGLDGSLRMVGALSRNYDFPLYFEDDDTDQYLQSLLRIVGAGRPRNDLSYEVHLVQAFTYFSGYGRGEDVGNFNLANGKTRYRAVGEASEWWNNDHANALLWLDRFNVKLALEGMDLTLGRQAITLGKAHFWNPMDVYLPFDPNQFDRDYKAGVDALRVDIPFGFFSGMTFVAAFGRELDAWGNYEDGDRFMDASWYGSSLLVRFFTNLEGWDLGVQGGKIYGGYQLGGGMVGEIRGVELRGEVAYFGAHDSPALHAPLQGDLYENQLAAVFGLGRRFESSLILEMEYFYNGGGTSSQFNAAAVRLQRGAVLQMGKQFMGLLASYEFTPLLIGQLASIVSLTDGSFQLQPMATLSLSDNADLLVGANINVGKRPETGGSGVPLIESEFGSYPDSFFAEIKVYF